MTNLKDLNNLTVTELKATCKANNLKGYSKLNKSELVELLTNTLEVVTTNDTVESNEVTKMDNNTTVNTTTLFFGTTSEPKESGSLSTIVDYKKANSSIDTEILKALKSSLLSGGIESLQATINTITYQSLQGDTEEITTTINGIDTIEVINVVKYCNVKTLVENDLASNKLVALLSKVLSDISESDNFTDFDGLNDCINTLVGVIGVQCINHFNNKEVSLKQLKNTIATSLNTYNNSIKFLSSTTVKYLLHKGVKTSNRKVTIDKKTLFNELLCIALFNGKVCTSGLDTFQKSLTTSNTNN